MAASEQELRCAGLVADWLSTVSGSEWQIDDGPTLDEQHPNQPSPDLLLIGGTRTAAVEVKRLTGDSVWNTYHASLSSLQRSLAPPGGGHWVLLPCDDFRLPMDLRTRRLVKKQIAALGHLRPGEEDVVEIPREAAISLTRSDGPGHVWCTHTFTGGEEFALASARLDGMYFVVDEGQWEHSFVTQAARDRFVDALVEACLQRASGELARISWKEEWRLLRGDDLMPGEVDVVAVTEARSVPHANQEAVDLVYGDALAKFEGKRWADLHIVVLDTFGGAMLSLDYLMDAIASYEEISAEFIDFAFVAEEKQLHPAWPTNTNG